MNDDRGNPPVIDMHVHSEFSVDSETPMDEYCLKAITSGIRGLCFTDHVDYNRADDGFGYYKPEAYFGELDRIRDRYSDRLLIFAGIEFSEPHQYPKEFEQFSKMPYDFILGSVHFWMNDMFASKIAKSAIPLEKSFERYWEEVFRAVSAGEFDALAHIDFPKRYYQRSVWSDEGIRDIFSVMKRNGISLEINTSSLRKGLQETMPGPDLLDIYRRSGCRTVTIGSDSHRAEDLGAGVAGVAKHLGSGLENVVYIGRKQFSAGAPEILSVSRQDF